MKTIGLSVDVYRAKGYDCTNGGVSSRYDEFVLTGPGVEGPFEPSETSPELVLVVDEIMGKTRVRAEPKANFDAGYWVERASGALQFWTGSM